MRIFRNFAAIALCAGVFACAWTANVQAADGGLSWEVSYPKALANARRQGKMVLVNFTGSDWCKFCHLLHDEVFAKKEFVAWIEDKFVLLEVDFPMKKKLPEALSEQNAALDKKYGVGGSVPTILFLDGSGELIGRTGYMQGGPDVWLKAADEIIAKRPRVRPAASLDEGLAAAKKAEKPLLLVVEDRSSAETVKEVDQLLLNISLAKLDGARLVAARLDRKPADDATAAAFKRLNINGEDAIQIVATDADGKAVLHRAADATDKDKLVAGLKSVLPKIKYDGRWLTEMKEAEAIAEQNQSLMMIEFTGSDWCEECSLLKKDVLDTPAFKAWAKKNVVLVMLDFPQETPNAKALIEKNAPVLMKYQVKGFPTVIFTKPGGEAVGGYAGYKKGLGEQWLKDVQALVSKHYAENRPNAPAESKPKEGADAGVIRLKNGKTIRGHIAMQQDDTVLIEREDGSVETVKKSDLAQ